MKKLNAVQKMMVDTGMLEIKLDVKHEEVGDTEFEVVMNPVMCDYCQENFASEDVHTSTQYDQAICESCMEHFS